MSSTPHSHRGGLISRRSALVPGVAGALGVAMQGHYTVASGIHEIKHVIVIEQENRSFDSYFGTYPGADGIPMSDGQPTVRVRARTEGRVPEALPRHGRCQRGRAARRSERQARCRRREDGPLLRLGVGGQKGCGVELDNPACSNAATPDVMGYHTSTEIPNYWTYAEDFTLDDHMFEPVSSVAARSPLPRVGLVGQVLGPEPEQLCQRDPGPLHAGADAAVRGPGPRHRHSGHHRRLDGHHMAPLQQARLVGLLRANRGSTRLRQRLGRGVPSCGAELPHSRHLEPSARLRGRPEGPPDPQHPAAEQLLRRGQEGDAALGHVGHAVPGRQRAPAGERPSGPGLRHRGDQRGHEEPRLGRPTHPPSPPRSRARGRASVVPPRRRASSRTSREQQAE